MQPADPPHTEYDVDADGETMALPPLKVNELAPAGLRVNADPAQMLPPDTVTVSVF